MLTKKDTKRLVISSLLLVGSVVALLVNLTGGGYVGLLFSIFMFIASTVYFTHLLRQLKKDFYS